MSQIDGVNQGAPALPPELERYIFETAARIYRGTAARFALVSRRVQLWMEPLIYETVTLASSRMCTQFLFAVDAKPPTFFASTVKSLCIPGDIPPDEAKRVLNVCQGVVNLAYWIISCPMPTPFSIITFQPKRLSINTFGLFGQNTSPDFGHPFFSKVTHLEIVDWPWRDTAPRFDIVPCLTHLALDVDPYDEAIVSGLRHILNSCQQLRVLLCLVREEYAINDASTILACIDNDDGRLVILLDSDVLENWEASLNGDSEACQWTRAEAIINVKRSC